MTLRTLVEIRPDPTNYYEIGTILLLLTVLSKYYHAN